MIFDNELLSDITCMIELAEQKGNTVIDADGSSLDTSSVHTNNTIESSSNEDDELGRSQSLVDQLRSDTNNNVEQQQQSKQEEQGRRRRTRQHKRGVQRRKSTNCLFLLFKNKNKYNISSSNKNNDDNNNDVLLQEPLLFPQQPSRIPPSRTKSLPQQRHSTKLC